MSFPSISEFFYIIFNMAWYTLKYYLNLSPWSDVSRYSLELSDWFSDMRGWTTSKINSILNPFKTWTQDWVKYLDDWRAYLKGQAEAAYNWVADSGATLLSWYDDVASYVNYFKKTAYNYVYYFVNTGYSQLYWYINTAKSYVNWLINTAYSYVNHLINSWWNYIAWLVNTFYSYGQWLINTAYNYIVHLINSWWNYIAWLVNTFYSYGQWLMNTFYSYGQWFINTGYTWLVWLVQNGPLGLLAFVRDAMKYWYNVWSSYRSQLWAFLSDPTGYILAALVDEFLNWLEHRIVDNW